MAEGNRAAVHVEFVLVDSELFDDCQNLSGESFIDFDQVDVVEFQSGILQRDFRRRDRTDAHDVGIAAGDAPRDDAAERLPAFRILSCSNCYYSCAIDDSARLASRY